LESASNRKGLVFLSSTNSITCEDFSEKRLVPEHSGENMFMLLTQNGGGGGVDFELDLDCFGSALDGFLDLLVAETSGAATAFTSLVAEPGEAAEHQGSGNESSDFEAPSWRGSRGFKGKEINSSSTGAAGGYP
jgi:hypothetical protein